jgi:hypothetical protein
MGCSCRRWPSNRQISSAHPFTAAVETGLASGPSSSTLEVTTCEPWPALAGALSFSEYPAAGTNTSPCPFELASEPGDDSCDAQTC